MFTRRSFLAICGLTAAMPSLPLSSTVPAMQVGVHVSQGLTLFELVKKQNTDRRVSGMADCLNETNDMLEDLPWRDR